MKTYANAEETLLKSLSLFLVFFFFCVDLSSWEWARDDDKRPFVQQLHTVAELFSI